MWLNENEPELAYGGVGHFLVLKDELRTQLLGKGEDSDPLAFYCTCNLSLCPLQVVLCVLLFVVLVLHARDMSRRFQCQCNLILARTHFGGFGHSTEYLVQDKFFSQGSLTFSDKPITWSSWSLNPDYPDFSGHWRVYSSAEYLGDVKFGTSHFGSVQAWMKMMKHDEAIYDESIWRYRQRVCYFSGTHVDLWPECVGSGSKCESQMRHGSNPPERLQVVWKQLISNPAILANSCHSWACCNWCNWIRLWKHGHWCWPSYQHSLRHVPYPIFVAPAASFNKFHCFNTSASLCTAVNVGSWTSVPSKMADRSAFFATGAADSFQRKNSAVMLIVFGLPKGWRPVIRTVIYPVWFVNICVIWVNMQQDAMQTIIDIKDKVSAEQEELGWHELEMAVCKGSEFYLKHKHDIYTALTASLAQQL